MHMHVHKNCIIDYCKIKKKKNEKKKERIG